MTSLRLTLNKGFTTIYSNGRCRNTNNLTELTKNLSAIFIATRHASTLPISKNLQLITKDKINTKAKNFKLLSERNKPLVICMTWLMAKKKNVMKYANLYLDQGFDVLNVSTAPWQVLWPAKGIQLVAKDLLHFLQQNESYNQLVIHGFSVGAYLWGEVLVHTVNEKERYQNVLNRIVGQIWDSSVDVTEIHIGVPPAVFPQNKVLQNALQQYIMYHLRTFDKVATAHYIRASQLYHTNTVKVPALLFLSKADPIGAISANTRAKETWESMGIPVYWNLFEKSPHVGHFRFYPDVYKAELYAFLQKISLIAQPDKMQVKV